MPIRVDDVKTTGPFGEAAQPTQSRRELEAEVERIQRALAERAERVRAD